MAETTIVFVYHPARDERATLSLPLSAELTVKEVRALARDRFNTVFGTDDHSYTVDKLSLVMGENSFRSTSFTLRDEDRLWDAVNPQGQVFFSCSGDVLSKSTTSGEEDSAESPVKQSQPQRKVCFKVKEVHNERFLVPDKDLKQALRGVIPVSGLYKSTDVEIPLEELIAYHGKIIKEMKEMDSGGKNYGLLQTLTNWLGEELTKKREHVEQMLEDGVIAFWDLWQIFPAETMVVVTQDNVEQGYRVLSAEYAKGWEGIYLELSGEYAVSDGQKFYLKRHEIKIPAYGGVRPVVDLAARLPTAEQIQRLTARGRELAKLSSQCTYVNYDGIFRVPQGWRPMLKLTEKGKVMIDIDNYNRASDTGYNNDFFVGKNSQAITGNGERNIGDDDVLFTFFPWFPAFSFRQKRWGLIAWECTAPIRFNHSAFDALVMQDNDQKRLIRGLVKQRLVTGADVSEDVISGKGGGCIFLLYGPPGTGKTLTAEATAELLERPLYQITVAELGTDAEDLEQGLENALRLASHWRAVVLMDEADNFLERRGKNDLARNAMVSVFLRLLEYYDGVLFLTTNRVEDFDPAFYSRISMPILYPKLTREVRMQVWENLLRSAKVSLNGDMTLETLAEFALNGREIRSCIYLAQCTAQFEDGDPQRLSSKELLPPIHLKLKFKEAMEKGSDE